MTEDKEQIKNRTITKLLNTVEALPSIPNIAVEVIKLSKDESAGANDIVKIIQLDQGITGNCLKICNGAYFGRSQRVESLKEAVVILGIKNVIKVVFASTVVHVFDSAHIGYGLRKGELWRHSVSTALISQMVAKTIGKKDSPVLFTAALLHDIGKLVMDSFLKKEAMSIFDCVEKGLTEVEAEKEIFGVTHADLGAYLLASWQFPDVLCNSVQDHHTALYSGDEDKWVYAVVRLSNIIAKIASYSHDGISMGVSEPLLQEFNITNSHIGDILIMLPDEMAAAVDFLNLR
jgi:putative nucleotidyltransferase with HDIG domain